MSLLSRAIGLYGYVFHPTTAIGLGAILLIYYEWDHQSGERAALWKRVAAFLGAGVLGFVPTVVFFLLRSGQLSKAFSGSSWELDMMVASGVFLAAAVTWGLWRHFEWGALVPGMMLALIAVIPPYAALSPFWNISGHVIFAVAPTLYLALVDRTFAPLLLIPVLMVPMRVLVEAHTVFQSVAGFVVATAIVVTVSVWRSPSGEGESGATTTS